MMYRITWADRLRAAARRIWNTRYLVEGGLLLLLLVGICTCHGCWAFTRPDPVPLPSRPALAPPLEAPPAPGSIADLRRQLADNEAANAHLKQRISDAELAPVRACLVWVEVIAALLIVAGVALAVASRVWGLGIGMRLCVGLAVGGIGLLGASLATAWAIAHVAWLIAATAVVVGGLAIWYLRDRASLAHAAREVWQHVPDDAPTSARVDALLDRLTRTASKAA